MTCSMVANLFRKMQKAGAGGTAYNTPTEPLIDSDFDSQQRLKNKKAHRIMGFDGVIGGVDGTRTRDPRRDRPVF